MSSDPSMDESTDIDFEIIILNISFRRLQILAVQTSRSLCGPANIQAVTEALNALQIGSLQNIHQGNTCIPTRPRLTPRIRQPRALVTLATKRVTALPFRMQSQPGSSSLRSPAFTPRRHQETNDQHKGHDTVQAMGHPHAHFQPRSRHTSPAPRDHQGPLMQAGQARPCSPDAEQSTGRHLSFSPASASQSKPCAPRGPANTARSYLREWRHQPGPCFAPTLSSKSTKFPPCRHQRDQRSTQRIQCRPRNRSKGRPPASLSQLHRAPPRLLQTTR